MFYWLIELSNTFPGLGVFRTFLNVFRYITFRTGGAVATGALFVFLFGPWIIDHLRLRQGKGQPIRTDGPQSHLLTKKGTPTMGGLMILSGLVVSTLLWANPLNPYVWIVLAVTLGFGFVGFYDDYLKVTKQSHSGFAGRIRLAIEAVIALVACYALVRLGRELLELGGAVALAELLLVGAEEQRHVQELRHRRAQRLVDDDLLGRVADVVVAADHMRDLHGDIVDHHRQVVGDGAV